VRGADASANIYSLIETCKHHKINPYDYLKFAITEINKCKTLEDYEKLLPYHFDKTAIVWPRPVGV
jgi:transposase